MTILTKETKTTSSTTIKIGSEKEKIGVNAIAPKAIGKLDMVIAFDTTGSMAEYIDAVRSEVSNLIPSLFRDNDDLRLGIVAFGDYCDMEAPGVFGKAFQSIAPTNNENELIRFIKESQDTSGGDGDEFYELVLKKIIDETPWREKSTRSILLISDANPHPLGYSYENMVQNNKIDWRQEARKAASKMIKIDTVTITNAPWYKELSALTNGVSVPFETGEKTAMLVTASVLSRGSEKARCRFDSIMKDIDCDDAEMNGVFASYKSIRDDVD